MAIYLVRHGETAANAARVLQTPDVPLSERGLEQAERLGRRLADQGIGQVLTSDFTRAAMTAEAIHAATGAPLHFEPLLQERNFGALRGTAYADLDQNVFAPDYVPPGGESWTELDARVARAWERVVTLAARTEGHLAVVTHGLVCRAVVHHHLHLDDGSAPDRFANTSLTIADGEPPHRVRLLACTAHLGEAAPRKGGAA